jgi:phage gp29-like protein
MGFLSRLQRLVPQRLSPFANRATVIATAAGDEHISSPADALGNPLKNLTPANAATLLQNAMRGQWTRAQWLMYYVEQWDADVWTLVERRCAGLRQLDWTIRFGARVAEEPALKAQAEKQQAFLQAQYAAIENMREAVEFLALAKFRGYSHLAISETRLDPLDQWWWVRDGMYGGWYYNPQAKLTTHDSLGEPVDEADYIIREEPRSLIWLAVLKFLRASHNTKWWDRFCEIASRHGTVIVGPPGLNDEQATAFANKAQAIARGGSGVLENGSDVQHTGPEGKLTGEVWESRLRYLKEDLILAGTGGMLTALSQATGIGSGQADEQGNVWRTLLRADAGDISEVLQAQFDKPRLRAEFGPDVDILAYFELDSTEEPSTDTVLDHALKAAQAGTPISTAQLTERTGYEFTAGSAGILPASPSPDGTVDLAEEGAAADTATLSKVALNGSQVTSLLKIAEQVAARQLPRPAAINMIVTAFGVDQATADSLLGSVGKTFFADPEGLANRLVAMGLCNRASANEGLLSFYRVHQATALRNRDSDSPTASTLPTGSTASTLSDAIASQLNIPAAWLAPVAPVLASLQALVPEGTEEIDPAILADAIEELQATLPDLLDDMGTAALAEQLEAALATAIVATIEAQQEARA